nr:DUF4422 domain-containing protein [Bifidobacterium primatium]
MFVSAHKPVEWAMPDGYEMVQAGAALHPHFAELTDDTGDNISERNPSYCEISVLYWIWKNIDASRVGLVQYRRYFFRKPWQCSLKAIMGLQDINAILDSHDIVVGQPITYHETVRATYERMHHIKDMDLMRAYIAEHEPDYIPAYDEAMGSRTTIYCNMLAARRDVLDAYMTWVMPLLDYAYESIDTSQYDDYNKRLVGFIAERLFNVWLIRHAKDYRIAYLPYNMLVIGTMKALKSSLFTLGLTIWRKLRG